MDLSWSFRKSDKKYDLQSFFPIDAPTTSSLLSLTTKDSSRVSQRILTVTESVVKSSTYSETIKAASTDSTLTQCKGT